MWRLTVHVFYSPGTMRDDDDMAVAAPVTRPPKPWSRRALVGGLVLAVLLALSLLLVTRSAVILLMGGFFVAWGCSCAAGLLLCGTAVSRLRRGSTPTWLSPVEVALIALLAGLGLAAGGLAVVISSGTVGNGQQIVVVGLGVVLVVWGVLRLRGGRARERAAWPLLGATLLAVWIPRELGFFNLHLTKDSWRVSAGAQRSESCAGGPRQRGERYRWVLVSDGIRGDLGERVHEQLGRPRRPGLVHVRVSGHIDVGGPACYLPLFRSASGRGQLQLMFNFTSGGARGARCTSTHRLDLTIDGENFGVATCRDLLEAISKGVVREIHRSVDQTL